MERAQNHNLSFELQKNLEATVNEIKARQFHKDYHASAIASALLAEVQLEKNWIKQAIQSEKAQEYPPMELAILLEKIVIQRVIENLWELKITQKEDFDHKLESVKRRIKEANWRKIVHDIPEDEWQKVIGKRTLQTNLYQRYSGIIGKVISPLAEGKQNKFNQIVDAGASGGMGVWSAIDCGLHVESWIAIDNEEPDLPWILTCSIRLSSILSESFEDYVNKITNPPPQFQRVTADMRNIPIQSDIVDIYLSIFSWYQLGDYKKALIEAERIIRPGGLIIVTDNVTWNKDELNICSPGKNGELTTLVWVKKEGQKSLGPFPCATWLSTDCTEGTYKDGFKEVKEIVRKIK